MIFRNDPEISRKFFDCSTVH